MLTALGGRLCENESGDCANILNEPILTRTYVPSVETEIKFTLQVPCLAVSVEVCISLSNTIDLSSFSTLLSATTCRPWQY